MRTPCLRLTPCLRIGKLDVYAHIPFCKQRCVFCHYPVMLGKKQAEMDQYLAAMEKEMDIYMRRLGIDRIKVRSILVGGGTPSYLSPQQLTHFLNFFTRRLDLSECEQFNWDVDPSTLVGAGRTGAAPNSPGFWFGSPDPGHSVSGSRRFSIS